MQKATTLFFTLWHLLITGWLLLFCLTAQSVHWSEVVITFVNVPLFAGLYLYALKGGIYRPKAIGIELAALLLSIVFVFISKLGGQSFG